MRLDLEVMPVEQSRYLAYSAVDIEPIHGKNLIQFIFSIQICKMYNWGLVHGH